MLRLTSYAIAATVLGCTSAADPIDTRDPRSPDGRVDVHGPEDPRIVARDPWTPSPARPFDPGACDGKAGIQIFAPEYLQRGGRYWASVSTSGNTFSGECASGHADAVVELAPPTGGRFRVSAVGSHLWQLGVRRDCTDPESVAACDLFTDFHGPDPFEEPLVVDVDIAEGESVFITLDGCLPGRCSYDVTVHPPLALGDECMAPGWNEEVRLCDVGLVCDYSRSRVGSCTSEGAPELFEVEANRDPIATGLMRFRVRGRDDSLDVSRIAFERLGARRITIGDVVEQPIEVAYLRDSSFIGVGEWGFLRAPEMLDGVTELRFWLIDASGLESNRVLVPLGEAEVLAPFDSCDADQVSNVCPPRTYCGSPRVLCVY